MKFIKIICIVLLTINFVGCKTSDKKAVTENVKLETANLNITGMTCQIGCAKTIESKISKLNGVTESKVSFEDKKGVFVFDSNKTSKEEIVSQINALVDGKTYAASVAMSSCKSGSEKPGCSADKKQCEPGSEKSCCKVDNKECKPGCEKACCDTKK